jgi:transposase
MTTTAIDGANNGHQDDRHRSRQDGFVAVALDGHGRLVGPAKRYSRIRLVRWLANLPPCLIGLEASSGAHHLARTLQAQGHAFGCCRVRQSSRFAAR